jgi:PAS domain S-box-containing protein
MVNFRCQLFHQRMTSPPHSPLLGPDLYQALWQHSTDLVCIIDAAGIMRYASPSYRRTLGYDPAAITGTSSLSRIHSDDRDRVGVAFQEAQHQPGAVVSVRFRYQHADGSWRVLEGTGANQLDDPGFTYVRAWMGVPLRVKDRVVGTTIRAFIPCP